MSPTSGSPSEHDQMLAAWRQGLNQIELSTRQHAVAVGSALAAALPAAVALLAAALKDPSVGVREQAVVALGRFGEAVRDSLPQVRAALKEASLWDGDDSIAALAAEGLILLGEESGSPVSELLEGLRDPSAPVRLSAARALGERGPEAAASAAAQLLQAALRDPDGGVRLQAAMALYKIDGREQTVIPMLVNALAEPNEVRRWMAADCLGEIGPAAREAVPALRQALRGEFKSPLIRKSIVLALEKIEPGAPQEGS